MPIYEVTYQQRPWTTNAERRLNRYRRAELVREWRQAFNLLARAAKIPHLERVHITVQPEQKSGVLQDVAACNPAAKAAIDGLVDAQVIKDDSPDYLTHVTFNQPIRGRNALTLIITSMEENLNDQR